MDNQHIAHMLRSRADKYGSKDVFRYKKHNWYQGISWSTFKEEAEQLSKYLLSIGVEAFDNIGILSGNRPEWTTSDLAILSVRGVVVPLYTTGTVKQISYISNETQMRVLFVGDEDQLKLAMKVMNKSDYLQLIITFDRTDINDDRVVCYRDLVEKEYTNQEAAFNNRINQADINDLATIIYTSGTTGEPKGAMLTHSNFNHCLKIHDKRLELGEEDVSMCFLPLSHVFERAWTFFLLYKGAINTYNINPKAIIDEMAVVKPNVMCVIPRFFEKTHQAIVSTVDKWPNWKQQLFKQALAVGLKYIEYQKDDKKAPLLLSLKRGFYDALVFSKVRKVFGGQIKYMPCAGAALRNDLLKFFHAIGVFVNYGYGATETVATISCMPKKHYDFDFTGDIMPDIEVKISDEGMILVKGGTVFKGYYKKPEETAEMLKDGWYYTGDKGFIPAPGKLHMTERIKDIIKTSTGKYISPQKIELTIQQSDLIEQICVVGDNRRYITALIVPCYETLKARAVNLNFSSLEEMVANEQVKAMVQDEVDKYQQELPSHERVVKMHLLAEPFSIENNTMTTTLKIRRKHIIEQHQSEIEALYQQ